MSPKAILFNPRSAFSKYRIPNSILAIASSIEGKFEYVIVDGNLETDPWEKILFYLESGDFQFFASTVMPGPQLKQAIPISKKIRAQFPQVGIIWGGYFPSNQWKVVLQSGFVDVVVNGPGDRAFPALLQRWIAGEKDFSDIKNLVFLKEGNFVKTPKEDLLDQDSLPPLPYLRLNQFYSLDKYLGKTFLGKKTIAYHSSIGCPFTCSFCAVVPIYEARWKGKSPQFIFNDIVWLKNQFGADAIEFHDNNFFVSEKRAVEFARLMKGMQMQWWGEARIDTMDKYSDESLAALREGGCVMIFYGAESGSDEVLKKMDKGGKQNRKQILSFARRLARFDIIPEYSFVLGTPAESPEAVHRQIDAEISFIKEIKDANPKTEIIIYTFSPVPTEGSELYEAVLASGFRFPETLEDWLSPAWEKFDLRKNPLTPWLLPDHVDKIRNFEVVLNGEFPSISDVRLLPWQKTILRQLSHIRYHNNFFNFPLEIKVLQKIWRYRQPEIEGM